MHLPTGWWDSASKTEDGFSFQFSFLVVFCISSETKHSNTNYHPYFICILWCRLFCSLFFVSSRRILLLSQFSILIRISCVSIIILCLHPCRCLLFSCFLLFTHTHSLSSSLSLSLARDLTLGIAGILVMRFYNSLFE